MQLVCTMKIEALSPDMENEFYLEVPDEADEDEIEKLVHKQAIELMSEQLTTQWQILPPEKEDWEPQHWFR